MSESESMSDFHPEGFEPIVSIGLKNMVALLVDKLTTFVIKIDHIDFVLTGQKCLGFFPVVHGVNEHCL